MADIRLTFGAMLIGALISVGNRDSLSLKLLVSTLNVTATDFMLICVICVASFATVPRAQVSAATILDLVHSIFICEGIWHYLVLDWGDVAELNNLYWAVAVTASSTVSYVLLTYSLPFMQASIAVTGVITFIVQMFFVDRVWRLSKHNVYLTIIIIVLAVVRLGSALTTTSQMIRLGQFSTFIKDFRWLFMFGLALSCVIDVLITSALCYYLQGNRTGYANLDDVIHRLLLYTFNNGYFNSLLATLNSRDALRDRDESHPMAVHISVESPTSQPRFRRHQSRYLSTSNSKENYCTGGGSVVTNVNGLGQTTTTDSVKVHINVEQTIHNDDGEVEVDLSPSASVKGRYLASLSEKNPTSS
ncbi:hypothetical protein EW145_g5217 [Phellinidium pouzarii]|uniref:DUF6534 domain-containing protein n=1 Tax=Phellinidium pouzarii TaxID=167371 RepID=A0A4S4L2N4_9AGAM|nr:hypothetical protein EW145_g5217 [Phellinidium pouzarii]